MILGNSLTDEIIDVKKNEVGVQINNQNAAIASLRDSNVKMNKLKAKLNKYDQLK
jgi:hypothetical protein